MSKSADHADIVASWKTKAVTINGKQITVAQFVQDMKAIMRMNLEKMMI